MPPITKDEQRKLELLMKSLSPEKIKLLLHHLEKIPESEETRTADSQELDRLLGRSFSSKERVELELDALARAFEYRNNLLKDATGTSEVLRLLGYTGRQSVHDRVQSQTLLAVKDKGALRFPLWQFDPQGPDGVVDGLPDVLRSLSVSDFAKLSWLVRPNPFLGGVKPIEALKEGRKAEVLQLTDTVDYGQN